MQQQYTPNINSVAARFFLQKPAETADYQGITSATLNIVWHYKTINRETIGTTAAYEGSSLALNGVEL